MEKYLSEKMYQFTKILKFYENYLILYKSMKDTIKVEYYILIVLKKINFKKIV